jgi:uncharacterized protein
MADRVHRPIDSWQGEAVGLGETRNFQLAIGESYSGLPLWITLQIKRAATPGPVVLVSGALHGDEINGTGAIRQLIQDDTLRLTCGSVIFVPVMNVLAFDRHSRYLPDRRDLNRCFPGSENGSLAGRIAYNLFQELVGRADYGVDLHTAAVRRTNYPTVRADMSQPECARIARAFGTEVIVDGKGPKGSFRREAVPHGCATIVVEGGEVWKVEPTIVESNIQGVKNVLRELNMLAEEETPAIHQVVVNRTKWVRAENGGFLQFHIKPGDVVESGQPLATNTNLLGFEQGLLTSPFDGVVIGMTTLPAVGPGEPICHIGMFPKGMKHSRFSRMRSKSEGWSDRVAGDLASNVHVIEWSEDDGPPDHQSRP